MKITLIRHLDLSNTNTRVPESLIKIMGYTPPLGLAYIAAVLKKNGYDVDIIDSQALNIDSDRLSEMLLKRKPDIVGVTAMTPTLPGALEAARIAKAAGAVTVMGGPHLSACLNETLGWPFIDYGVVGEGEYPMLELVRAIEENKPVNGIKGLAYKSDGRVVSNGVSIVEDIDALPFPARELLPNERYSSVIALHPMTTIVVGRGCPFQCSFCFKQESDKKVRIRDFMSIVDEIELCVKTLKVKEVMIIDDTFTIKKDYVESFCKELIARKLNVKWESTTRVDVIDPALLSLMKSSGCVRLRYGVESGDENTLRLMNKKISVEKAVEVFNWTRQAGIESFAYFIIGYLGETAETVNKTINFSLKLDPDMAMYLKAVPMPCTGLFRSAAAEGFATKDYWEKYTAGESTGPIKPFLPRADEYVKKAYHKFYLRPSYILRQIKKLNSIDKIKKYSLAAIGLIFFKMR